MATPDFNKIWATNSPLTKYEFTDENYLTGWNFIGSIPPARSMFDTLQKSTDEKLKWLFDESATQKDITVDDTSSPTSNTAKLLALINNLANMEKQIKGDSDWKTAPGTNLATLATLVSNLASGSDVTWSGKKFTNAKLGITGLIDQNGYVSFGPNFVGLIIQWGESTSPITFPIAFNILYAYEMLHYSSLGHKTIPLAGAHDGTRLFFDLWNMQGNDYDAAGTAIYIAVGK